MNIDVSQSKSALPDEWKLVAPEGHASACPGSNARRRSSRSELKASLRQSNSPGGQRVPRREENRCERRPLFRAVPLPPPRWPEFPGRFDSILGGENRRSPLLFSFTRSSISIHHRRTMSPTARQQPPDSNRQTATARQQPPDSNRQTANSRQQPPDSTTPNKQTSVPLASGFLRSSALQPARFR